MIETLKYDTELENLNLKINYGDIDFNSDITRDDLNNDIYENKFKFVDKFKSMTNPHPKYISIINQDLTMRSYFFLKINNAPLKLYPYQDLIGNDTHRYRYFRAANQIGKSLFLDVELANNFTKDHGFGYNAAIVSKSLPQSMHQMRRLKGLLNSMNFLDWKIDKGSTDNMSIISIDFKDNDNKYKYSNLIICAPCTEGLLGYDLHDLYLDEFEFWEVDIKFFFNQIAQPRTYHTKGRITITTNPNGGENFGAELEKQITLSGNKKWHVYVFNFLDKPGNTIEEYNELKNELSRQEFESTVDAVRSISDKKYFTADEIERSEDKSLTELSMIGKQPFMFFDVGSKHDQCCLGIGYIELGKDYDINKDIRSNMPHIAVYLPIIHLYPVGYPLSRAVGSVDENQDNDGWHYEKSVKEYNDEWCVNGIIPNFGYDITGNAGMKPLFNSIGLTNAIDITFSGPSKSGYYQRFKYVLEKGLLHRIKHKEWDSQARQLEAKKGARGYLLINSDKLGSKEASQKKKIPDDCMDMTAGLIHLMDNPLYIEPSVSVVSYEEEVKEEWTDEDDINDMNELNNIWKR